MSKYEMILAAEKQFAREVTLGVIVQQPLSVWHYLIPGMFIFDFLRRTSAISRYTKHFMFPRQLAIDAAQHLLQGYEQSAVNSRMAADIETWLNSLKLYSPQLAQAQRRAVDLLIAHYSKLLRAEGNSHLELIENAYSSQEDYEAHVRELTSAEAEIDLAILEKTGSNEKLKEKLHLEAQQVELRRNKILENIF
ncbi:MAG: NF038143 family protein [Desulfobacterales bacterium]|nr:MAG: NF038143 family protein [Desulfobacterales bacterium]